MIRKNTLSAKRNNISSKNNKKALYENIMRNVSKIVKQTLNESLYNEDELMESIKEFKSLTNDEIIITSLYDALENENPSIMRIINKYDDYVEDVIETLTNPNISYLSICSNIKEIAEENEYRNGTESEIVIEFINELNNWIRQYC